MANLTTEMGNFTPLFDVVIQTVGVVGASVYGRVWRYCQGERGVCQASMDTIANELDMSRQTVLRWLGKLCDVGYLEDTTPGLRNRPHTYRDTGKVQIQVRLDAVTEGDTPDSTVTESSSAVTESDSHCNRKSHEERKKREGKREEDDASASVPLGDLDLDEIDWHNGSGGIPDNGDLEKFKQTGDIVLDIVAASDLHKRRNIPDWAIRGPEGLDPCYPALVAFCQLTKRAPPTTGRQGKDWLKSLSETAGYVGLGAKELADAIGGMDKLTGAEWYLERGVWSSPRADSFKEKLGQFVGQMQAGTFAPANGWKGKL